MADANLTPSFITLPSKPAAKLSYTFLPAKGSIQQPLIVFLNGLGLPASSWLPTISLLAAQPSHPPMLSYDRYGQGLSDRDPTDFTADDPAHAHDCMSAVHDLHELIDQICIEKKLGISPSSGSGPINPPIFFTSSSLGCALSRLYAHHFPNTVCTLLLLDSVLANSDFISIWPDPSSPSFPACSLYPHATLPLPDGVTARDLSETRDQYGKLFHPVWGSMGRAEGISRVNLAALLPCAEEPVLSFGTESGEDKGPWVTVVGHGFDKFAEEGLKVSFTFPLSPFPPFPPFSSHCFQT